MASVGGAMAQLQAKRYADKSRGLGQPIYLIAVEFSKDTRNLRAFKVPHFLRRQHPSQHSMLAVG